MSPYVSLRLVICPYKFLCVLVDSNEFLWVLKDPPLLSLWILMGPYKSLCVLISPYGF